jgi:hypothetical protein
MNYKETMGEEQKQKLLENMRAKYQAIYISKQKELKEKRMEKKSQIHDIDMYIEKF